MPTFKEVCLVVATDDGARGARFTFTADRATDTSLELDFRDPLLDLVLTLHFVVRDDLIARHATLHNAGARALNLERVLSAALPLPPDDYDLVSLHGQWGREFGLQQRPLLPGRITIGSTRGFTSHEANPWFAIRRAARRRTPRPGLVRRACLERQLAVVFEVERNDALNVVIGISPSTLPGTWRPARRSRRRRWCAATPRTGWAARRACSTRSRRMRCCPAATATSSARSSTTRGKRPISTCGPSQQIELARRAAAMGVELFVVDDGWFGTRDHDTRRPGRLDSQSAQVPERPAPS